MPTLLVKGSQHPQDPLPGPAKDGTKTVPTPYIQCWYVQMTLVGIKMPTWLVKSHKCNIYEGTVVHRKFRCHFQMDKIYMLGRVAHEGHPVLKL